jgi:hypothetical protein
MFFLKTLRSEEEAPKAAKFTNCDTSGFTMNEDDYEEEDMESVAADMRNEMDEKLTSFARDVKTEFDLQAKAQYEFQEMMKKFMQASVTNQQQQYNNPAPPQDCEMQPDRAGSYD